MFSVTKGRLLLCATAIALAYSSTAYSQSTFATVTGTVADKTGAIVPKATIKATNLATNIRATTVSNDDGDYTLPQLKEGTYSLTVEAPGFKQFVVDNVELAARDTRRIDATLEVGTSATTVEVKGGATLIETETARIEDLKTEAQLKAVPLNTRALWPILTLTPGLVQGADTSHVRFSGSRANEENWSVDGTSFSDGVDNTQMGPIANKIESYQEVKVDLANNSAEFGTLGQVTVITKSGTNNLHGAIFDYFYTPAFRARDTFALAGYSTRWHFPGGSVGGPVYIPKVYNGKNKTFFFYSYETSEGNGTASTLNPTVPVAAWRQGNFSNISQIIYDPTSGMPFPANQIPSSRINSVSQKIQDQFYPMPNYGNVNDPTATGNFRQDITVPWSSNWFHNVRVDHKISDKDSIFGRYSRSGNPDHYYDDNLPTIPQALDSRYDQMVTVSYTHIFTPTIVNEFRWGSALNNDPNTPGINGLQETKALGIQGLAPNLPNLPGLLNVNFYDLGIQPIAESQYTNPGYRNHREDFQELFSWFRGKHSLKFGFAVNRIEWDDYTAPTDLFGSVSFSNRFTGLGQPNAGNDYADFLLGIPTTSSRSFPPLPNVRNRWEYDFFATDEFKVSPRLTLSLGARYQVHPAWHENSDQISNFDINTGQIIVPDGGVSKVSPLFPTSFATIVGASKAGYPSNLIATDKHDIAPRIGAAYRPFGDKTVFRAGFGVFYDVAPFWDYSIGGEPFVEGQPAYNNPLVNPGVVFPNVFPAAGAPGPTSAGLPKAVNPNLRIPYSLQYNFTIERQIGKTGLRASYIGTDSRQGYYEYNINSPVPNAQLYIDKPRRFPQYGDIMYLTNGAGHRYNGLTLMGQRQLAAGLLWQFSWTWARDIYDEDYNWDLSGQYYILEDPLNRQRDVGPSKDIPTSRITSNLLYELPFGRGKHFASGASRITNLAIGGWQMSAVFVTFSGQFLTPLWSGPDPTGTTFTDSSSPAYVTIRPDVTQNPNLPSSQRSINQWYNVSAFTAPQLGSFGTSGRGVVIGPGLINLDTGIQKQFLFFPEAQSGPAPRLWFEFSGTNIMNHPNYSNPSMYVNQGGAGVITSDGGVNGRSTGDQSGARVLRLGLRFEW
jgi:hypothetical protein